MTDESEKKTPEVSSEKDDAKKLETIVNLYCAKHPESTLVFSISLSGSGKMRFREMGDPEVRAQMANQLGTRAVAAHQQMQRTKIAVPGEMTQGEITDLLATARKQGMQGG